MRSVMEPQPECEAEDADDEKHRAKGIVREREHRRRDPCKREEEPERSESQKANLQRPLPAPYHSDLAALLMKRC